jgi:hypothetical protein
VIRIIQLELKKDSELNDADHRVYVVKLDAVVNADLQQKLDQMPQTMENAILRGRIKGIISLGGIQRGQKITTELLALVERDPTTDQWSVIGLTRHLPTHQEPKE